MGSDDLQDQSASHEIGSSAAVEAESNNIDSCLSSDGDITRKLESAAEILTQVELDLACCTEKLVNLDILVMHVASRESDFEAFASEEEHEHAIETHVDKALEFDFLYGFLDSEIRLLEDLLYGLQTEIVSSSGVISSFNHLGGFVKEMEEKIQDCEDSLKLSVKQVSYLKSQCAQFGRILLASSGGGGEEWKADKELIGLENGDLSNLNEKIKMHTAEQQRNILRLLEKSLAQEMDLEKKLTESKQTEEDLKFQLQQEVYCSEHEAEDLWERVFDAENTKEVLLGTSEELIGQVKMVQLHLNASLEREKDLISKLQDANKQLKENKCVLEDSENSRIELLEKVATAEADNKFLRESNLDLNDNISDVTQMVEQLERQLKNTEIERLHAVASAEANQEKLNMLDCTIMDMDNLIKDLKSRVLKAEIEAESAEEKCILLSESNAELSAEVNLLRCKTENLETSLSRADEAKKQSVKDIRALTKLIADFVVQLALERERLHKEVLSFKKEKKFAAKYSKQIKDRSVTEITSHDSEVKESTLSRNDSKDRTPRREGGEEIRTASDINPKAGNILGDPFTTEIEAEYGESSSELDTVRNIDARQLKFTNFKYVMTVTFALGIPLFLLSVFGPLNF